MKISECKTRLNFFSEYNTALGRKYSDLFIQKSKKLKPYNKLVNDFLIVYFFVVVIALITQVIHIVKGLPDHSLPIYCVALVALAISKILYIIEFKNLELSKKAFKQAGKCSKMIFELSSEDENRELTDKEFKMYQKIIKGEKKNGR